MRIHSELTAAVLLLILAANGQAEDKPDRAPQWQEIELEFNAALLMTVQPDMDCSGPRSRTADLGFDVGFEDLPQGTLRQLRPDYFQYFDRLVGILVAHGIAPVYQPVFHGYGWKGRRVAGNVLSAEDYARYCRYLVARIFEGLPFAGMEPNWTCTYGRRGLLLPGRLFVLYLPEGGSSGIISLDVPRAYRIVDPRTGRVVGQGRLPDDRNTQVNSGSNTEPRVVVFTAE